MGGGGRDAHENATGRVAVDRNACVPLVPQVRPISSLTQPTATNASWTRSRSCTVFFRAAVHGQVTRYSEACGLPRSRDFRRGCQWRGLRERAAGRLVEPLVAPTRRASCPLTQVLGDRLEVSPEPLRDRGRSTGWSGPPSPRARRDLVAHTRDALLEYLRLALSGLGARRSERPGDADAAVRDRTVRSGFAALRSRPCSPPRRVPEPDIGTIRATRHSGRSRPPNGGRAARPRRRPWGAGEPTYRDHFRGHPDSDDAPD